MPRTRWIARSNRIHSKRFGLTWTTRSPGATPSRRKTTANRRTSRASSRHRSVRNALSLLPSPLAGEGLGVRGSSADPGVVTLTPTLSRRGRGSGEVPSPIARDVSALGAAPANIRSTPLPLGICKAGSSGCAATASMNRETRVSRLGGMSSNSKSTASERAKRKPEPRRSNALENRGDPLPDTDAHRGQS